MIKRNWKKGLVIFTIVLCVAVFHSITASSKIGIYHPEDQKMQPQENLEVHFLDVGQADCILIESDGYTMLIDAGNTADERFIMEYLLNEGIEQLDYVIATHGHEDHIGGMDTIVENFPIGTFFMNDRTYTTRTYDHLLDALSEQGIAIHRPVQGERIQMGEGMVTIVTPTTGNFGDDINDYSIGIKLEYASYSFLICGDIGTQVEAEMVADGMDLSADVLKLNHHGSKNSNSELFLDAVNPECVVITCGRNNPNGHPAKRIMKRIAKRDYGIYRTDEQGTILFYCDGKTLSSNIAPTHVK